MNTLRSFLEKEKLKYEKILRIIINMKFSSVNGRLEVKANKYSTQYYHITRENNKKISTYIPKKDIHLAKSLAQKNYIKK